MSNEIANLKSRDGTKNLYPITKTECVYDSNNQNLDNLLGGKQATLVSGTNIKTINNQSILGSGNITIQGGGGSSIDVQIDSTSIVDNGVANILTKNSNYNSSTNKLITESDLSGYVESNTQIQGESTIYNQIGSNQGLGGIVLASGDDELLGEPTKMSAVLITPDLALTQSIGDGLSAVSQVTARTGTDMYSAETSENNTNATLSLNIQKEASALDIQLSAEITDTQTDTTTSYSSALHASAAELDLNFPVIVPVNTNTTDLGSSLSKFKDLYLSGSLKDGTNTLTLAGIQPKSDNTLNTTSKTVVGAINEVNSIAKQANIAKSFANYSAFITELNSETSTTYKVGQSFYIETLEVPDLWVISVESSSSTYTYTTDAAFVTATGVSGGQQVGYYKIGQLETQKVDISTKMDKANPTGTGSFSLNRKANTTIGDYSVAEGYNTTASGEYSHAEGHNTEANELGAHAEGDGTVGGNIGAHAEGVGTLALGMASHTEGINTIAYGDYQHVFGKDNVGDSSLLEIVGNGTSSARSNARTLDWNGNEWLAGKITPIGGISDGNNANYELHLPDTTSWVADKTIATTDQIPDMPLPSGFKAFGFILAYTGSTVVTPTEISRNSCSFPYQTNGLSIGDHILIFREEVGSSTVKYHAFDFTISNVSSVDKYTGTASQINGNILAYNRAYSALTLPNTFTNLNTFTYGISDGNNNNYKLTLPNSTSWTADKTIATTDQIPDTSNFVTTNTAQTIGGAKTFTADLVANRGFYAYNNINVYGELIADSGSNNYDDDWYAIKAHISVNVPDTDQLPASPTGDELPEANVNIASTICYDSGEDTIEYFIGPHVGKTNQYGTYFDIKDYNDLILIGDKIKAYGGIRILDSSNQTFSDDGGLISYDSSTDTFTI